MTPSVHATALAVYQSLLQGAESLPTLMRTTSPDRSPLAQKLYFLLCLSYIFPENIHSSFSERKVAIQRERLRVEPGLFAKIHIWPQKQPYTRLQLHTLPLSSLPSLLFSSSLPPFCFPTGDSQTSPMTLSDSCLCTHTDFLFHKKTSETNSFRCMGNVVESSYLSDRNRKSRMLQFILINHQKITVEIGHPLLDKE